MIKTSILRKLHRVLGVAIGVQVILWTVSGAIFAWNDIESVRGDDMRTDPQPLALEGDWVAPTAIDFGDRLDPARIAGISLVRIGPRTCYRVEDEEGRTVLADVATGKVRGPVTSDEAVELALASFGADAAVSGVARLEEADAGAHHEYRGGPFPAWVVQMDHASDTRIYVSLDGGAVTKHRNRTWRVFDFFWMLHTMDYRGRDDFNHPLIRIVALAAIALAASGYLLFGRTSAALRRRR